MARTKQSARQCTGATAPRGPLGRANQTAVVGEPSAPEAANSANHSKRQQSVEVSEAPAAKRTKTMGATTARTMTTRATTTLATTTMTMNAPATTAPLTMSVSPPTTELATTEPATTESPAPTEPVRTTLGRKIRLVKTTLGAKGIIEVEDSTNGASHYPLFCYACQNGGGSIACDECPRILCFRHASQIAAVPADIRNTLKFRCPSCHTKQTRSQNSVAPYYGLYHPREPEAPNAPENPYLSDWVKLHMVATRPQHVQVDNRPLLILSVRLAILPETNSPARLLFNYLVPWFEGAASSGLRYIDIPFNMSDPPHAPKYRNRWDKELAALGPLTNTRVVLFIYNHSHVETGDLFYGEDECSESLAGWWNDVISPGLKQITRSGGNQLTVAMLVCGSLLANDAPRRDLGAAVTEMGATHTFAFITECLQPLLTTQFFQAFALRILLEGTALTEPLMATLLEQSVSLARHSGVWHVGCAAGQTGLTMRSRGAHHTSTLGHRSSCAQSSSPPRFAPALRSPPYRAAALFPSLSAVSLTPGSLGVVALLTRTDKSKTPGTHWIGSLGHLAAFGGSFRSSNCCTGYDTAACEGPFQCNDPGAHVLADQSTNPPVLSPPQRSSSSLAPASSQPIHLPSVRHLRSPSEAIASHDPSFFYGMSTPRVTPSSNSPGLVAFQGRNLAEFDDTLARQPRSRTPITPLGITATSLSPPLLPARNPDHRDASLAEFVAQPISRISFGRPGFLPRCSSSPVASSPPSVTAHAVTRTGSTTSLCLLIIPLRLLFLVVPRHHTLPIRAPFGQTLVTLAMYGWGSQRWSVEAPFVCRSTAILSYPVPLPHWTINTRALLELP
ncbi:hypothetical protein LXA43DRAFT_1094021 [Ganoderma leucocontextum]|nr:hypothetical protein LXA43DRAFT_1094021 [Ganoderma leucocontextum]